MDDNFLTNEMKDFFDTPGHSFDEVKNILDLSSTIEEIGSLAVGADLFSRRGDGWLVLGASREKKDWHLIGLWRHAGSASWLPMEVYLSELRPPEESNTVDTFIRNSEYVPGSMTALEVSARWYSKPSKPTIVISEDELKEKKTTSCETFSDNVGDEEQSDLGEEADTHVIAIFTSDEGPGLFEIGSHEEILTMLGSDYPDYYSRDLTTENPSDVSVTYWTGTLSDGQPQQSLTVVAGTWPLLEYPTSGFESFVPLVSDSVAIEVSHEEGEDGGTVYDDVTPEILARIVVEQKVVGSLG